MLTLGENEGNMWRIAMICLAMVLVSACSNAREDLKSPCVGAEDSPCGPKRAVNDHWLS